MRGFTLLELLISITLTAVVVLMLSLSLRTGLRAWSRGQAGGERAQAAAAVNGLLDRQLRAALRPDTVDLAGFSDLAGTEEEVSLVTTHAPLGAQAGGLLRAVYRFEKGEERLIYAQRILTRQEDVKEELPAEFDTDATESLAAAGWAVSVVSGVKEVRFAYQAVGEDVASDPDDWEGTWEAEGSLPAAVAMRWQWKSDDDEGQGPWQIHYLDPLGGGDAL